MAKRRPSGDGMVRKRNDGRWEGRIVVGHKDNGDSIFRYVYAGTQKELTAKLHQCIEAYQGVNLTEMSRITLLEWLDQWLVSTEGTVRSSTLNRYRRYIENHIRPTLGEKKITQIRPTNIQKLYDRLGHTLASSTVRDIHTILHHALRVAVEQGIIPANPTDEVRPPQIVRQPMKVLNEEQLDAFMEVIKSDPVWYDFFYTELTTGLRRGEICGLRWEDFDERDGTLKICRTLHKEKGGVLVTGNTKTYASKRKIVLPPSVTAMLTERKKGALTEWIFPNPIRPEDPINPESAYRQLKKFLSDAGLPSIRFHDLRHTFSTHALASGVDAKTLSGILGHTKASFTLDTYTHITGDMQKRAADIVGGFLTDYLGEEMKPWEENAKMAKALSG